MLACGCTPFNVYESVTHSVIYNFMDKLIEKSFHTILFCGKDR